MAYDVSQHPSPQQVLAWVRRKITEEEVVFGPEVAKQIETLKKAKRIQSEADPEKEYRTVIDLDLISAVLKGVATQVDPPITENCWAVTVEGPDKTGGLLVVHVQLSVDEEEPLLIWSFTLPQ